MPRNGKTTVQFTANIPAGTNQTLSYQIKSDATVERINGKFYPGQQGALQVQPYLLLTDDRREELVMYPNGSNRFLSGDDQLFDIPVDFEVNAYDQIIVYANNISTYDYTLYISFVLDYMGGKARMG